MTMPDYCHARTSGYSTWLLDGPAVHWAKTKVIRHSSFSLSIAVTLNTTEAGRLHLTTVQLKADSLLPTGKLLKAIPPSVLGI